MNASIEAMENLLEQRAERLDRLWELYTENNLRRGLRGSPKDFTLWLQENYADVYAEEFDVLVV